MSNERICAIHDAAARLFIQQGYSKTQISHIAKSIGVSVGTIYHDFSGKQEIRQYILKCTLDPEFKNHSFERPITNHLFSDLEQEINSAFEKNAQDFSKNLELAGTDYSFEDLISDAFDLLSRYAIGCLFIEKNYMDCQEIAHSYLTYRQNFIKTMEAYLQIFIAKGIIRPLDNVKLSTALIVELLTWWAMDRNFTSFQPLDIPCEQAKAVCMDNIISAYKISIPGA